MKIQSILRQRQGDPPSLEKVHPTKPYCYETIEQVVSLGNMYDFLKVPKKRYKISNFIQLHFPINHMTFISAQYQLIDKFEDREEFKKLKMRFHVVLRKKEEEIWSLVKIVKVLGITKDQLFKGLLQNFCFHVVRANNVAYYFTVADFPLMNLNDLICVSKNLSGVDASKLQVTSKEYFLLGFAHIKLFIDNYYDCLALTDVELTLEM